MLVMVIDDSHEQVEIRSGVSFPHTCEVNDVIDLALIYFWGVLNKFLP